jgi:hypothetical protein
MAREREKEGWGVRNDEMKGKSGKEKLARPSTNKSINLHGTNRVAPDLLSK